MVRLGFIIGFIALLGALLSGLAAYRVHDQELAIDRIALARAIKELPDGYRTIFLLHEVEGYEHQEIAELLDCSVGNSKSQLHKAKLRIRELLGRARQEEETGRGTRQARQRSKRTEDRWEREAVLSLPRLAFSGSREFTATGA